MGRSGHKSLVDFITCLNTYLEECKSIIKRFVAIYCRLTSYIQSLSLTIIVNESSRTVVIMELTCPWDGNIDRSHEYKEGKYSALVTDLSRNFRVRFYPIEVSVRGQVTKRNGARLKSLLYDCCDDSKKLSRELIRGCSKIALLSSYSIFLARKEPSWGSPSPIVAR